MPSGRLVPYDGVPTIEYVTVAIPVTVVYVLLSVAGIIFAILCLIFNFVYRNKRQEISLAQHNYICDTVWEKGSF